MAQEFPNEFTVLIWPKMDRNYLQGHAGLKISQGAQFVILNAEDGNGVQYRTAFMNQPAIQNKGNTSRYAPSRAGSYQLSRALAESNERQRSTPELEALAKTAPVKLKLPIMGGDGPHWGLPPCHGSDFEYFKKENRLNLHQVSTTRIAYLLEQACLDAYARPPAERGQLWSLEQLQQWVRAGRRRMDELNRMAADFLMTMQLEYGKGYHLREPVTQLMSVEAWRTLSSDGNFIRGGRTQKLDKLLADYHRHQAFDRDRIRGLIPIFELCVEYRTESRGSRTNAVMQLGKQVLSVLRSGLKREAWAASTEKMKEMGII